MADAPPAPTGQRSVTLDIGAIESELGEGIDIEEAYRLVTAAMENDTELLRAVGAARERAVEAVKADLAPKATAGGLEEYRRVLDGAFEGAIDSLTESLGMTSSADRKNTFNSAFDAFAAANAAIYRSSADFRRECIDLLAKRALAETGGPVPEDFDARARISEYIGELSREQATRTISSLHGLKVSEVLAAGRRRIAQALGDLMRKLRGTPEKKSEAHGPQHADLQPMAAAPEPAVDRKAAKAPRHAVPPSDSREEAPAPKHAAPKAPDASSTKKAQDSDERLRDLINGIGTSLKSGLPAGVRGRHAAPARPAADDIDEPAGGDNIVEFKPRGEHTRDRSAAIESRVPRVPPVQAAAAAGAACASSAAPIRNYSLNLR